MLFTTLRPWHVVVLKCLYTRCYLFIILIEVFDLKVVDPEWCFDLPTKLENILLVRNLIWSQRARYENVHNGWLVDTSDCFPLHKQLREKQTGFHVFRSTPRGVCYSHFCWHFLLCPSGGLLFTCSGRVWACCGLNCASAARRARLAAYPGFNGIPLQLLQILSQKPLDVAPKVHFNGHRQPHISRLRGQDGYGLRRRRPV